MEGIDFRTSTTLDGHKCGLGSMLGHVWREASAVEDFLPVTLQVQTSTGPKAIRITQFFIADGVYRFNDRHRYKGTYDRNTKTLVLSY